jgi:hypothetical protein
MAIERWTNPTPQGTKLDSGTIYNHAEGFWICPSFKGQFLSRRAKTVGFSVRSLSNPGLLSWLPKRCLRGSLVFACHFGIDSLFVEIRDLCIAAGAPPPPSPSATAAAAASTIASLSLSLSLSLTFSPCLSVSHRCRRTSAAQPQRQRHRRRRRRALESLRQPPRARLLRAHGPHALPGQRSDPTTWTQEHKTGDTVGCELRVWLH